MYQMFEQLASNGSTTFSIDISQSCETCYNVRLLKVRVVSLAAVFSGEKRCVTILKTAARETKVRVTEHLFFLFYLTFYNYIYRVIMRNKLARSSRQKLHFLSLDCFRSTLSFLAPMTSLPMFPPRFILKFATVTVRIFVLVTTPSGNTSNFSNPGTSSLTDSPSPMRRRAVTGKEADNLQVSTARLHLLSVV